MKKKLLIVALALAFHVGSGAAQVSDSIQGAADGEAAFDDLDWGRWGLPGMAAVGGIAGAVSRNLVSSWSEVATQSGIASGLAMAGGMVSYLFYRGVPDELAEEIADRPTDYRMSFEREYRRRYRSHALVRGILGGLVVGAAYALAVSTGNDRLDDGPSFTLISVRIRF